MDAVREQGIPGTPVLLSWDDGDAIISRLGWLQESDQKTGELRLMTQHSDPDYHVVVVRVLVDAVVRIVAL